MIQIPVHWSFHPNFSSKLLCIISSLSQHQSQHKRHTESHHHELTQGHLAKRAQIVHIRHLAPGQGCQMGGVPLTWAALFGLSTLAVGPQGATIEGKQPEHMPDCSRHRSLVECLFLCSHVRYEGHHLQRGTVA